MDGHDQASYAAIHGRDLFGTVQQNILRLHPLLNNGQERLYLQIMKINETEPFLDAYYDYWEAQRIPVILQKQNTFMGLVEDRRYSDLSPLERRPCWHLLRDLVVLHDGTVPFCKQDINACRISGSLCGQSLPELVESRRQLWLANYKADYPQQPDCASCDEWYTFNM
jgi:spiro-SPASM protein